MNKTITWHEWRGHVIGSIAAGVFVLAVVSVGREWLRANALEEEIHVLEQERAQVLGRVQELESLAAYADSQAFVEEQARESFGLVKPGESVAIIPRETSKNLSEIALVSRWQEWVWWVSDVRALQAYREAQGL